MHGIKDVTGMIHTLLKCRQAAVIGLLSAALLASVGQVQPAAQTGPAGPDRSPGPKSDPMAQARRSYNEQKYEEAIAAATEARRVATSAAPASVVLARAHLERYRVTSNGADLIGARDALKAVDAAALSPRDQVELSIALGESLYLDEENTFDDRYSAAAEQFEVARGRLHPRIDPVDKHEPARGRSARRQQQGVIPACTDPRGCPRREPAQAVGLKPFGVLIDGDRHPGLLVKPWYTQ